MTTAPAPRSARRRVRRFAVAGVLLVSAAAVPAGAGAASAVGPVVTRPSPGPLHILRGHLPSRGPVPHVASTATTAGPVVSTNWSGQVATGGTYTSVQAGWTVPTVATAAAASYSATWIGIDGTSTKSLIQTGTSQDTGGDSTSYQPWYELLPGAELPIHHPVAAGDTMSASITETSTDRWSIVLADASEHWTFTTAVTYATPGTSAEWIEEAPTVDGVQTTLADFGSTTFSGMSVSGPDAASSTYTPVYLVDADVGDVVSWPDAYDPATSSFTVQYGSPTPVVTAVSPSSGPTTGGTTVTVSGLYLFAATRVRFGSTATADFRLDPDGTVTVAAPPGPAGVVDIELTSPDTSSAPSPADRFTYSAHIAAVQHGYWLVGADGGIFSFGSAAFHGSTGDLVLQRPVVGITPTVDRKGYWLVATDGGVFAFGDAGFYGSLPGLGIRPAGSGLPGALNAPIVGMVPSADGRGYFMVASDGGVFAFGDAGFEGSCPGSGGCSGAAVSVLPDAGGRGYWLVTATGSVYTFGDADALGEPLDYTDGGPLPAPVVSTVRTPDGEGYWILLADGIVLPFGTADLYPDGAGGTDAFGRVTTTDPATAVFATGDELGYWVATAGGGIFAFGSAPDDGSMAGQHLNAPVIAAAGW